MSEKSTALTRLRSSAIATRDDVERRIDSARGRFWLVDVVTRALERDGEVGGFVIAGAIAFRLFVYLLPMFLLVLVVGAVAFSYDPAGTDEVASGSGLSSYVVATLSDATETTRKSLWILVPATLWALYSAGRTVWRVVALAHADAWRQPAPSPRTSAAVGVFAFVLIVVAGMAAVRYSRSQGYSALATVVALAFYCAAWLAASLRMPRAPGATWADLVPGAVLVGLGSQGLYLFNVAYLQRKVESASEAYGALGLAATGLLWLYLLGRLIVAAPVLNAVVLERRLAGVGPFDSKQET